MPKSSIPLGMYSTKGNEEHSHTFSPWTGNTLNWKRSKSSVVIWFLWKVSYWGTHILDDSLFIIIVVLLIRSLILFTDNMGKMFSFWHSRHGFYSGLVLLSQYHMHCCWCLTYYPKDGLSIVLRLKF